MILCVLIFRGCELGDVCALSPLPSSGHTPPPQSLIDQSDCFALDSTPRIPDSNVVKCFLKDHDRNRYNHTLFPSPPPSPPFPPSPVPSPPPPLHVLAHFYSGIIDLVYSYLLLLAQQYNWRW